MTREARSVVAGTSKQWAESKINGRHLERLAVVYVRQATLERTPKQQESIRVQCGLTERAAELGWPSERVRVIDEDLGRSGATVDGRPGFQRLMADVGLGRVGVVLAGESSRLTRSYRDWHQLVVACAKSGTLLADVDAVYDPSDGTDRVLLGLSGSVSGAELNVARQRLLRGQMAQGRHGDTGRARPKGVPPAEIPADDATAEGDGGAEE